jgi:hypothetical protein
MRVVPNGEGSELVFTLIRQPGMSDTQFAEDKAAVLAWPASAPPRFPKDVTASVPGTADAKVLRRR